MPHQSPPFFLSFLKKVIPKPKPLPIVGSCSAGKRIPMKELNISLPIALSLLIQHIFYSLANLIELWQMTYTIDATVFLFLLANLVVRSRQQQ